MASVPGGRVESSPGHPHEQEQVTPQGGPREEPRRPLMAAAPSTAREAQAKGQRSCTGQEGPPANSCGSGLGVEGEVRRCLPTLGSVRERQPLPGHVRSPSLPPLPFFRTLPANLVCWIPQRRIEKVEEVY